MENNKENQNKQRLGRGIGSLLGGSQFNGDFSSEVAKPETQPSKTQPIIHQSVQQPVQKVVAIPALQTNLENQKTALQNVALNSVNSVAEKARIIGSVPGFGQPQKTAAQTTVLATATTNSATKPVAQTASQEIPPESRIWKIAIDKIVPGLFQPRKTFEKEKIEELAQSIRENGILQPIAVRKRPAGGFEIIAGERRWRAAQVAGLHEIPALIKTLGDKEVLQLAIIENVQREDLDPIEEAEGYARLIKEFGYSQQDVATRVGKDRATVANALRLNSLQIGRAHV